MKIKRIDKQQQCICTYIVVERFEQYFVFLFATVHSLPEYCLQLIFQINTCICMYKSLHIYQYYLNMKSYH